MKKDMIPSTIIAVLSALCLLFVFTYQGSLIEELKKELDLRPEIPKDSVIDKETFISGAFRPAIFLLYYNELSDEMKIVCTYDYNQQEQKTEFKTFEFKISELSESFAEFLKSINAYEERGKWDDAAIEFLKLKCGLRKEAVVFPDALPIMNILTTKANQR